MVVIAQYLGSSAIVPALRSIVVSVMSLAICVYGPGSRTEAADSAGGASAVTDAKAAIHRRVELRQDGSIMSDGLEGYHLIQVDAHECDLDIRGTEAKCIFLIYELQ